MFASRFLICLVLLAVASQIVAEESKPPSVFDLPRILASQQVAKQRVAAKLIEKDFAAAEKLLRASLLVLPHDAAGHYNLACALARQEKAVEAFESLTRAIQLGFRDRKHMEADDDLEPLREDQRFQKLLKMAAELPPAEPAGWKYKVAPAEPDNGQVLVSESNTAWNSRLGVFHSLFKFDPEGSDKPIAKGFGEAGELLRRWYEEETAAGNHGDVYDNHDNDHSNMQFATFPQLTRVEFSEKVKARGFHNGLQRFFQYNTVTIGNSSTAITSGPFWRSQPRNAITQPGGALRLYLQYMGNHLYFYPEHRDHDTLEGDGKGPGRGDVFPANTPYTIISQGSSGSDRIFMNAVAATLAAFRPDVKVLLKKTGLLMPTVQMIFRSSNKTVATPEDYLTGKAHPTVFDGKQLDVVKMVTMAHEMRVDSLPPIVQMKVMEEDEGVLGRDYFDDMPREKLFDTPCAIARVVKSTRYERRMVVSVQSSKDLHRKPLKFHWVVLRGDAQQIRIRPRDDAGSVVELLVPYHRRRPVTVGSKLESNRVEIGVFAHNGDYFSAPGFISLYYLDNELREYDDQHRIRVVDYSQATVKDNYVDPRLDFRKDWRDEYQYSDDGKLLGWTRIRGQQQQDFTADGRLIVARDDDGEPVKTTRIRYLGKPRPNSAPVLEQHANVQP